MKTTTDYEFVKATKTLIGHFSLALEYKIYRWPETIDIVSEHTGKTMTFKRARFGEPGYDEDHWDGEMMLYRPLDTTANVKALILRA